MRRVLAALVIAAGVSTVSPLAAHAVPPVGVTEDRGCYYVWISAKTIPLFCLAQP